jgi:hypothetical protein
MTHARFAAIVALACHAGWSLAGYGADQAGPLPPSPPGAEPPEKVRCLTPEEYAKWLGKPLEKISLDIRPEAGPMPLNCGENPPSRNGLPRVGFPPNGQPNRIEYQWTASGLWWHRLYFDDVPLERYGQTINPCLQPFRSAICFCGDLIVAPYTMATEGPCAPISRLGYYREGDCDPPVRERLIYTFQSPGVPDGCSPHPLPCP